MGDRDDAVVGGHPVHAFRRRTSGCCLSLFTISLTGMATAISLNFSLVNDLLRNPEDSGKAMSILIVGGNTFGVAAPIVTGYVIQATGSYNWAFGIAGLLLVAGATILFTMTRTPIEIAIRYSPTQNRARGTGVRRIPNS